MTPKELSDLYGIPEPTLRYWRRRGEGPPFYRLSPRVIRYRAEEVATWWEDRRIK